MRYKIQFTISHRNPDGSRRGCMKYQYAGNTIEEAVEKIIGSINPTGEFRKHNGTWVDKICTSFRMRRDLNSPTGRGGSIKWKDYIQTPKGAEIVRRHIPINELCLKRHAERHGWQFLTENE